MKKLIKRYFLAFAEETFFKNLMIAVSLVLIFLILLMFRAIVFSEDNFDYIAFLGIILILGIILNQILVSVVKKSFILMPPPREYSKDSSFAKKTKGEKIILKKPIWAKGIIYKLKTTDEQSYWSWSDVKALKRNVLVVKTVIADRWKNSTVKIPMEIKIYTEKDFNPIEVFEKVQIKPVDSQEICLPKYIRLVFDISNEKNYPEIQKMITKYVEMRISESALINEVIDLLIFPERLFSNVKNVQICLNAPTISSCERMVCGK